MRRLGDWDVMEPARATALIFTCYVPHEVFLRLRSITLLWLVPILLSLACLGAPAAGQDLKLVQAGTGLDRITVRLGEVITVDVVAELGVVAASGAAVFISFPDGPFQIVDSLPDVVGVQPFVRGEFFSGGQVVDNLAVPRSDVREQLAGRRLLDYSIVIRASADRGRSGSGVVTSFSLRCIQEVASIRLTIDDNVLRETRLVLPDSILPVPFRRLSPADVTVKGIDLLDIPDVVILPGQTDSLQIGRLDKYVLNNLAPFDSLRWSFQGSNPDSLSISIGKMRRHVTAKPLKGWRGGQAITWTVTEPKVVLPGEHAPTASGISNIIVNTPPRFIVKRDTVRLIEDQNTFIGSSTSEPDPARAFRGADLDLRVHDDDVPESRRHTAFKYAPLTFRSVRDTLVWVKARVHQVSHELLLWTRPNFSGVDSFRVVVADEFTYGRVAGQDTTRVVLVVDEVPDRPRFVFAESSIELEPEATRAIPLAEFIADVDSPLQDLTLTWTQDAGGKLRG